MASFQARPHGQARSDVTYSCSRPLVVRDRIGQDGYTQEHYDLLSEPWRRVVGKIHPDDVDLTGEAVSA